MELTLQLMQVTTVEPLFRDHLKNQAKVALERGMAVGGGVFSLSCKDFGGSFFYVSFSTCVLIFFFNVDISSCTPIPSVFGQYLSRISPQWLSERR